MDIHTDIHITMSCVFLEQILFRQVYFAEAVKRAKIKTTFLGLADAQLSKYKPNGSLQREVKSLEIRALFPTIFSRENGTPVYIL